MTENLGDMSPPAMTPHHVLMHHNARGPEDESRAQSCQREKCGISSLQAIHYGLTSTLSSRPSRWNDPSRIFDRCPRCLLPLSGSINPRPREDSSSSARPSHPHDGEDLPPRRRGLLARHTLGACTIFLVPPPQWLDMTRPGSAHTSGKGTCPHLHGAEGRGHGQGNRDGSLTLEEVRVHRDAVALGNEHRWRNIPRAGQTASHTGGSHQLKK